MLRPDDKHGSFVNLRHCILQLQKSQERRPHGASLLAFLQYPEGGKGFSLHFIAVACQEVELHGGQDADNDEDHDRVNVATGTQD